MSESNHADFAAGDLVSGMVGWQEWADLGAWVADGSITWRADVDKGFENVPKTLLRLYSGANFGKQLLEL